MWIKYYVKVVFGKSSEVIKLFEEKKSETGLLYVLDITREINLGQFLQHGCTKFGQIDYDILAEDEKLQSPVQEIICRHERQRHKCSALSCRAYRNGDNVSWGVLVGRALHQPSPPDTPSHSNLDWWINFVTWSWECKSLTSASVL